MTTLEVTWGERTIPNYSIPANATMTRPLGGDLPEPYRAELLLSQVPKSLIRSYAAVAASKAKVEEIERGHWFANLSQLAGVWGDGNSRATARADFEASIVAWVEVKIKRGVAIPPLEGAASIDLPSA